jgi:hypothetical protein
MLTGRRNRLTTVARIAVGGAIAAALGPATANGTAVVTHPVAQSPAEVRDYWTPERMREARPLELPRGDVATARARATPSAAPSDQEIPASLDTTYPYRIHGRVFLRFAGKDASCSGTVVTSSARNLILTAGHCLAQAQGGGHTLWATDLLFVPAYRNGSQPFGTYPGISAAAPLAWAIEGDVAFDAGVVNLAPGSSGEIQDQLGSRGIAFNRRTKSFRGKSFQIFGYPAEPASFYNGERPILCDSGFRGIESFSGALVASPCSMQQGASGGGWVLGGSIVTSLTSHAGCPNPAGCSVISGTYLGQAVFKLWSSSGGGLPAGRKKRIRHCKRLNGRKRDRCLARAETFQPVVLP